MRVADKVQIAWIDPGQVDGAFTTSLIELVQARSARIDGIIRIEGGLLSRQRNEVVKTFLDHTEAAWLLMIDSDEQLHVPAFDKLINAAHDQKRPVVAGLYFGTWPQGGMIPTPVPHVYLRTDDGVSVAPILDYPEDTIIAVDAAGTGCLLIHRSVLEQIREQADPHEGDDWCWFRDLPMNGMWLGEDLYFCRRIQALGTPIHAHTGAVLPHRRRYWLDDAQFRALREREAAMRRAQNTRPDEEPKEAEPANESPRDIADHRPMQTR